MAYTWKITGNADITGHSNGTATVEFKDNAAGIYTATCKDESNNHCGQFIITREGAGCQEPPGDASWAEYTGGNGIRYVLHNNSGVEARFSGKVILNLSRNPNDWVNYQQANANMWQSEEYHTNEIIIPTGGIYTSPEVTEITSILHPGTNYTDGTWYLMNSMTGVASYPVYLYTREYSRSRREVSGSQNMYAATPTVDTKLLRGYTYHLNVNWVNPGAMLADENLTVSDFLDNHTESYAILAKGKENLG